MAQATAGGYTAMIKQEEDGWWIGWVEEIPGVIAQESSRDELLVSLREALLDILEINREEARRTGKQEHYPLAR